MESFKFESVLALQQKRTPSDWISSRVEFFLCFTGNWGYRTKRVDG